MINLDIDFTTSKLSDLVNKKSSPFSFLANHLSCDIETAFDYVSECYTEAMQKKAFTYDDSGLHFSTPKASVTLVKNEDYSSFSFPFYAKFDVTNSIVVEEADIAVPCDAPKVTTSPQKPLFKENKFAAAIHEFANLCGRSYLYEIGSLTSPEKWSFVNKSNSLDILENYIKYSFYKAQLDGNLCINEEKSFAAFNTGLVDFSDDFIYVCFRKQHDTSDQKWCYWGACTVSSGFCQPFLLEFCNPLPKPNSYIKDLNDVYFNIETPYFINFEHIINDRIHRLPTSLLKHALSFDTKALQIISDIEDSDTDVGNECITALKDMIASSPKHYNAIKSELNTCINRAIKKITGNYRLAIPAYFPVTNSTNFLLPFEFDSNGSATSVLVIQTLTSGNYFIRTILTPRQAYLDARLLGKIDNPWLTI